ncbi:MAG: hypothetical protein ACXVRP_01250 [Solirubrobacteraceae bacterium]
MLTAFAGPRTRTPISVTSPTDPGSTHTYTNWARVTREVVDARVWEGIHFRFSDKTGADVGREVANWDLRRLRKLGVGTDPASVSQSTYTEDGPVPSASCRWRR